MDLDPQDPRDRLLSALKASRIERQLANLLTASACATAWALETGEPHEAAVALNEALADAYAAAVAFREERVRRW